MIPLIPALALAFFSFISSAFIILRIVIPILPPSPLSRRVSPVWKLHSFRGQNYTDLRLYRQSLGCPPSDLSRQQIRVTSGWQALTYWLLLFLFGSQLMKPLGDLLTMGMRVTQRQP
jgi:hypothetical protein